MGSIPSRKHWLEPTLLGLMAFATVYIAGNWAAIVQSGMIYTVNLNNSFLIVDFVKLYSGAKLVALGKGQRLYDADWQEQAINDSVAPNHYSIRKFFQYPP